MSGSSNQNQGTGFNAYTNQSSNNRNAQSNFGQNWNNQGQYNTLADAAGSLFNNQNWGAPAQQQQLTGVAQQAQGANTGNMQGGVYGGLNIGNQLMDSLQQSQNTPSATSSIYGQIMGGQGNNYADAMKQQYILDADRAQKQMMGNLSAQAAGAGMSGSSREGVAQAMGMNDINRNLQSNMAQTGYNTFDKDLQNKLGIAQQADTNNFNRQQLMSQMLGQQQGTVNQGIQGAQGVQGMYSNAYNSPWAGLQNYAQAIGNPVITNSGQSSNQSSGQSFGTGAGSQQQSGSGKSSGLL